MNLFEMHARRVMGFRFSTRCIAAEKQVGQHAALGFSLLPDELPQIVVEDIFKHRPFRAFPPDGGWFAASEEGTGVGNAYITLTLRERVSRYVLASSMLALSAQPTLLPLPWPPLGTNALPDADLEISIPLGSAPVYMNVSRTLDRKALSSLCRGKGIEIGPGVGPQVLPAADIDVTYAEEKGREDWLKTYAYKMNKYDVDVNTLPWERYHTRPAFDLPAENDSLDFIFSSHVLEHLVNPLGHLQHWLSKLKPGGLIAGIMPHCDYSVDYQLMPSLLPTMALEYQRGDTKPNIGHYRTIFGDKAEERMAEGRTLHVHFYNERNLSDLLAYAASALPIAHARIQWERNYKEFFFVIGKR